MTIHITIERLNQRIHLASAASNGSSRVFTSSSTGYRFLVNWARELAQGEDIEFVLPSLAQFGRLLADWLQGQGERVRAL